MIEDQQFKKVHKVVEKLGKFRACLSIFIPIVKIYNIIEKGVEQLCIKMEQ